MKIEENKNNQKIEKNKPNKNNYFFITFQKAIEEIKKIEKEVQEKMKEKEKIIIKIFELNGILKLEKSEVVFMKEIISEKDIDDKNSNNKKQKKSFNFSLDDLNKKTKKFLRKFKTRWKLNTLARDLLDNEKMKEGLTEEINKININKPKNKGIFLKLEKKYKKLNLEIKEEMKKIVSILEEVEKKLSKK
ncbi:MAG: hypothetical protein HPAVJP_4050 [Candidatus Hepatoplasma vulgare]|nr:MAG: hypothetical protein HPAVJP_4050 [Candidatus Hepatoplasma sp.]